MISTSRAVEAGDEHEPVEAVALDRAGEQLLERRLDLVERRVGGVGVVAEAHTDVVERDRVAVRRRSENGRSSSACRPS